MNEDLIKRSDAIKVVRHISMGLVDADTRQKLIEALPSADRPQGEWKDVPPNAWECNGIVQWRECSVCKCRSMFISNYCPHCGAKMKGADDE